MDTLFFLFYSVDGDYGSSVFLANSVRGLRYACGGQGIVVVRESYNGDAVNVCFGKLKLVYANRVTDHSGFTSPRRSTRSNHVWQRNEPQQDDYLH